MTGRANHQVVEAETFALLPLPPLCLPITSPFLYFSLSHLPTSLANNFSLPSSLFFPSFHFYFFLLPSSHASSPLFTSHHLAIFYFPQSLYFSPTYHLFPPLFICLSPFFPPPSSPSHISTFPTLNLSPLPIISPPLSPSISLPIFTVLRLPLSSAVLQTLPSLLGLPFPVPLPHSPPIFPCSSFLYSQCLP